MYESFTYKDLKIWKINIYRITVCGTMFDLLQYYPPSLSQKQLMKNLSIPKAFLFLAFITITFTNCRNKIEFTDPIVILGKWNVFEYKIDSEEQLGKNFNSVTLNFGEIRDGVGPVAITTEDITGGSLSQGGEYSLSVDLTIIYITIMGNTVEYAINFDSDNLLMQGTDENNQLIEYSCEKE